MSIFKWLFGAKAKRSANLSGNPTVRADAIVAQLQALAQPCVRLFADGTGKSRLGGVPDMATPWPRYEGRPLCCVAQLDLAELRAAEGPDWLPASGRLIFFYELEHGAWGLEAKDAGSSVVVYETGDLVTASEPADLSEHARFPAHPVAFAAATSLPSEERLDIDWKALTKEENRAIEVAVEELQPAEPVHQVGGFPQPVQSDQMEMECQRVAHSAYLNGVGLEKLERTTSSDADWRLLFQIDTDNDAGMMWGDTGMLYFWIREQDAQAGDFSKIWMILQCC